MAVLVDASGFSDKREALLEQPFAFAAPQREATLLDEVDASPRAHGRSRFDIRRLGAVLQHDNVGERGRC